MVSQITPNVRSFKTHRLLRSNLLVDWLLCPSIRLMKEKVLIRNCLILFCVLRVSLEGKLIKEDIGSVKKSNTTLSKTKNSNRCSVRLSNVVVKKEEPYENESPTVSTRRSTSGKSNVVVKKEEQVDFSSGYVKKEFDIPVKPEKIEFEDGFDRDLLSLEPQNVARVVPGRILVVKFLPCENVKMIAAGDRLGNVGFWNLDCENEEDDDGIYLFTPHSTPVSSIVFQQNSFSRVISSSYDGLIRLMDVEKLVFDLVYSTDEAIFSLSQRPNDEQSLFFGEGNGMFNIWDLRAAKSNFHWDLHERRINSITRKIPCHGYKFHRWECFPLGLEKHGSKQTENLGYCESF